VNFEDSKIFMASVKVLGIEEMYSETVGFSMALNLENSVLIRSGICSSFVVEFPTSILNSSFHIN
jgi:hypothetical protein